MGLDLKVEKGPDIPKVNRIMGALRDCRQRRFLQLE
jgi:hypothetical protein